MIESDPALVEIIEENKKDELSQYRWDIIRVASELLQSLAQEVNVLGGDYPEEALFLAQENTHQRQ
ncbi:hypothetical protein [Faunimonas pinastri]|nr:hypothetical protein [Faunimonas pinastri]